MIRAGGFSFPARETREHPLVLEIQQRSHPGTKQGTSLPPEELRIQEKMLNTQLKKTGPGRDTADERRGVFLKEDGSSIPRYTLRQSIPANTAVSCTCKYIFALTQTVNSDDSWEKSKDG